jgi:transposase-like protein
MTDETTPTATTKRQATRKTAGRKPGQKVYSQKQRAAALMIVDLFDGNVARAAQATGIERKTLFKWRDELELEAGELQQVCTEASRDVVAVLKRLIEALCVIVLMKAQDASVRDLYYLMGIILDKIEKLSKVALDQAALGTLRPAVATPERKVLPPSVDVELQKAHWESIVQTVRQQAQAEGKPMTRAQAIAMIIESRPEAKEYLMPDGEPYLM